MTDKKAMPEDAAVALLWLECKQICRGLKSTFFPNVTLEEATEIRKMGFAAFMDMMKEKDEQSPEA